MLNVNQNGNEDEMVNTYDVDILEIVENWVCEKKREGCELGCL